MRIAKASIRPRGRSKLQADYAKRLELLLRAGEVLYVREEPFSLKLADNTHYRPDFLVVSKSGELEVHEAKGHMEDDAWVKVKVAASLFPFRFVVARRSGKEGFELVEVNP